jgi:hypothetical protein
MRDLDDIFEALSKSSFRRQFHLRGKELDYLRSKGLPVVLAHAGDFVSKRLAPAMPVNDGKQTPFRGHRCSWHSMQRLAAVAAAWRNGI